ncbi:unnamed protein product [Effrenium voratum]|nr:unnamed protein product [Effrenium voratum]
MSCWRYARQWLRDITDRTLLNSPFTGRHLLPYLLTALILQRATFRCIVSLYVWSGSATLISLTLSVLPLFMQFSGRAAMRIASEVIFCFGIILEAPLLMFDLGWTQGLTFAIFHLAACASMRIHPFGVLLLACMFVDLIVSEEVAPVAWTFWWHGAFPTYFIHSVSVRKFVTFGGWMIMIAIWYTYSFSKVISAVKNGTIISQQAAASTPRAEPNRYRGFCFWWKLATEDAVRSSPLMARSASCTWLCASMLWGCHLVLADSILGGIEMGAAKCGAASKWQVLLPMMASLPAVALAVLALRKLLSDREVLLWESCLLIVTVLPQFLNAGLISLMKRRECYSLLWDNLAFSLSSISGVMALATLAVANVHPMLIALGGCTTLIMVFGPVSIRLHNLSGALYCMAVASIILFESVLHFSIIRCVWAAMERGWQNALSLDAIVSQISLRTHTSSGTLPQEVELPSSELLQVREWPPVGHDPCWRGSFMSGSGGIAEETELEGGENHDCEATRDEEPEGIAGKAFQPAVAVLRHGERADVTWGSTWSQSPDAQQNPADCPITPAGIEDALEASHMLRTFAGFGIVVSSPYLRCVQTAIIIADQLNLTVLLDHELGEVFGPCVFESGAYHLGGHPWRQRFALYQALKSWEPTPRGQPLAKPAVRRVSWKRILGAPPSWPERLPQARTRYARRFLSYLRRSRLAQRSLVIVSHGHMVQSCLKVLPQTHDRDVARVSYCGGLMARFGSGLARLDSFEETSFFHQAAEMESSSELGVEAGGDWQQGVEAEEEQALDPVKLKGWGVHIIGTEFGPMDNRALGRHSQHRAFLDQLRTNTLTMECIQQLLGELPQQVPGSESQGPESSPRLRAGSGTESSMRMFTRRSVTESICTSDFSEPRELLRQEEPPEPPKAARLLLKANPLLSRRLQNKEGSSGLEAK